VRGRGCPPLIETKKVPGSSGGLKGEFDSHEEKLERSSFAISPWSGTKQRRISGGALVLSAGFTGASSHTTSILQESLKPPGDDQGTKRSKETCEFIISRGKDSKGGCPLLEW